jgi:putative pyruvate formate lyase activating enzyme
LGFEPGYIRLYREGRLGERIERGRAMLRECSLCPRACGVDRLSGQTGYCASGGNVVVASYGPHFGEEFPLVGSNGSGTIFLSSCNLLCVFCQNYEISKLAEGYEMSLARLGSVMARLCRSGCHNINFVSPTHFVPQILEALPLAVEQGLDVPLVYNTGGYDSVETIRLLQDVFDIYMPDFKFWDSAPAERYCNAPDYREASSAAMLEMHRQVGDLAMDGNGIAVRGLLVRHLVMPGGAAGTPQVMKFLAEMSPDTYVNIMDQYRPCGLAADYPEIARRITPREYREAIQSALDAGLTRLDKR